MLHLLKYIVMSLLFSTLLISCSQDGEVAQTKTVNLIVHTSVAGVDSDAGNRAYVMGEPDGDNELIHSLTIVVVRPNGVVEHLITPTLSRTAVEEHTERRITVIAGETKRIYLFANLPENFADAVPVEVGKTFPTDKLATYTVDGTTFPSAIPMYGEGEVWVDSSDNVSTHIYLVRTAAKITFQFENQTGDEINITNWKMESVADKTYLVPRIHENNWLYYMLTDANDGQDVDSHWITQYDIPADAEHAPQEGTLNISNLAKDAVSDETAAVYLHESKYILASLNHQQYQLTLTIDGMDRTSPFPNLWSLVRNTHVRVYATITESSITFEADVYPYEHCELEPIFGQN